MPLSSQYKSSIPFSFRSTYMLKLQDFLSFCLKGKKKKKTTKNWSAQRVNHLPTKQETGFNPWVGKIPWRREWHPTPVPLPGKSHRRRSLVGYSPRGRKEVDTTEQLHFHFRGYMGCGAQQVTQKRRHFIQYFSSNFHTSEFTPHYFSSKFYIFLHLFFP